MLEHVAMSIKNVEDIKLFYQDILGFEMIRTFELSSDYTDQIFGIAKTIPVYHLKKNDLTLEIFISEEGQTSGFNHICISWDDREMLYDKAKNFGYSTIRISRDGNDLIFIKDRCGNLFEIKHKLV